MAAVALALQIKNKISLGESDYLISTKKLMKFKKKKSCLLNWTYILRKYFEVFQDITVYVMEMDNGLTNEYNAMGKAWSD